MPSAHMVAMEEARQKSKKMNDELAKKEAEYKKFTFQFRLRAILLHARVRALLRRRRRPLGRLLGVRTAGSQPAHVAAAAVSLRTATEPAAAGAAREGRRSRRWS